MSVKRYIDSGFWKDPFIQELSAEEKYFYLYILTNPLSNIAGVFEISLSEMSHDTGFDKEKIVALLQVFQESKKVFYIDNFIIIKNFIKHQLVSSSIEKGIQRIIESLPENIKEVLNDLWSGTPYGHPIDTVGGGCTHPIDTVGGGCTHPIDTVGGGCIHSATYLNLNLNKNLNKNLNNNAVESSSPAEENTTKEEEFIKPTIEELKKYIDELHLNVDAEYFYYHYESNGWIVGQTGMKDWKATVRKWSKNSKKYSTVPSNDTVMDHNEVMSAEDILADMKRRCE